MVLVEVGRKAYLASIVPVIVNAILNEHQIVVDIVAFVNKGDFPRSRLGEKQRGKILASWVTRKMHTMAQFGIRDAESGLQDATEAVEPRTSMRNSSAMGSSLRNVEPAPQIVEEREAELRQTDTRDSYVAMPAGVAEMPAQSYDGTGLESQYATASAHMDDTPTDTHRRFSELPGNGIGTQGSDLPQIADSGFVIPGFESSDEPPPRKSSKPSVRQSVILPAVEGREGDLWSLPSQQAGGSARAQDAPSDDGEDDSWKDDAIMHMNLAAG